MGDPTETSQSSEPLDLDTIRSRVSELTDIHKSSKDNATVIPLPDSDCSLKDCALNLESKIKQIVVEYSDVGFLSIEDLGFGESKRGSTSKYGEDQSNLIHALGDQKFEILELDSQIEKNKLILTTLQDLDSIFKRFDAVEHIEDALRFKVVQMFPNDVCIGDIIDAAKSFRQSSSQLAMLDTRSSLEWFVEKVQDRILLSTLRRYMVKSANKSRHSFEYLDRDETVVARLVGGFDAFIKVSQGWPLSNYPLKLVSVKSSDHYSKGISLSLLCKV